MLATYVFWATLTLFFLTALFYIVFISLVYYWHEKRINFIVIPMIYTFDVFIVAFFAIALLVLLLQFYPDLIKVTSG